jgi:hypothetical protein
MTLLQKEMLRYGNNSSYITGAETILQSYQYFKVMQKQLPLQNKRKCIHSLLLTRQHTIRSLTICSISANPADVAPSSALRDRLDDCKHTPILK